jgi:hypothetical protein
MRRIKHQTRKYEYDRDRKAIVQAVHVLAGMLKNNAGMSSCRTAFSNVQSGQNHICIMLARFVNISQAEIGLAEGCVTPSIIFFSLFWPLVESQNSSGQLVS